VVLRTFSKIYALAGLRMGYGVTTPELAAADGGGAARGEPPQRVDQWLPPRRAPPGITSYALATLRGI